MPERFQAGCDCREEFASPTAVKNSPIPQPNFLAQPCALPPLLVSETDARRLLSLGRRQVKELIGSGQLQVVEIDGFMRVVTASIVALVDRLAAEQDDKRATA